MKDVGKSEDSKNIDQEEKEKVEKMNIDEDNSTKKESKKRTVEVIENEKVTIIM